MNLTLHYTHGAGYYEDYKGGAKVKDYKLPPYIDSQGDTIAKTDLVRRKWLENDFYGAIYSANYRGERLQFSAGAAINRYDGDHFGRVMWAKQSNNLPEPDYEYYRNTGDKLDYNMYAKANYQFHPNLNGYLDMQYRGIHYTIEGSDDKADDHVNVDKHWNFFNPKAGINFQKDGHNAFVSFSVANREPNRDNFTEAGRDERPQHETLYDYEAGYGFGNSRFHVGANLYFMDYSNQLILTGKISEIGEALTSNIKDSYRMGIELTGGVKIARWLDWSGNLTLSRNKIKNFTESIEVYDADWNFLREDHNDLGTTDIAFSPDIIANSIEPLNIKGVLCTGDLVEQNEIRIPDGINGNQTSEEQWQAASRAFERLDDKISYVVCTGNHDYGYEKAENRLCHLPDYFPSERNSCWKKSLVETGLNYQGIPTLENAAYEFETDTWGKLLVISLEFAPRDEAIEWAAKVAGKAKYKNHKVILLTHSYMSPEAKRHIKESYKISPANYGEAIWQKLVYPSSNISMVICGHECEIADYKGNVSFRTDKNSTGKNVAQMMFNAQTADGQWHGNGGDCWLRIMEFMPDGKTIKIKTFSPLFALSPLTSEKAWRTDSYDQFDITIE